MRTERRGLPFMSRNEARTAAAPAAKTDFPGVLTCRGAGSRGSGEKRRDPKQPRQAPALHVPPARSGRGREGEAGEKGRGGRGAGTRVLPWRHLAGLWSPEGAEPLSSTEAKRRCAALLALPAGNKGGAGQRPRRAGSRLSARALSHPRSETRLRRALRTPARSGAPHLGQPRRTPPTSGISPRPFSPRRMHAPRPSERPYVTF